MKHRAILDPDGVYQGNEPAPKGFEFRPGDPPPLSPDCDLAIGRYQWDGKTFVPIRDAGRHDLLDEPHTLRAVARGFAAINKAQPALLPQETKDWLKWFAKTVDAKGNFDKGV